ncbi:50S ribosomal subunit assembly factor BipA [Buchnera aphidicola (Eriosoma grossulariae)]|uniref:translational GTPase TypA n=1 Tax=Buchnera aphidicola TaxID=9 RepID=UPI003464B234
MNQKIRNIAIIAHVDHGKTTLIDKLLQQSGTFDIHETQTDRIMDSNDLEKERGITILAKNTAIQWKGYHINIVDTPGHADFGGEVERVLSMVDSVLLVVDALEGPMPQTRFVTEKAFNYGINPIVVINKIDRENSRPNWVIDQIFDLFINLNANDKQIDFPIIYTSALKGISGRNINHMKNDMTDLYQAIIEYVPAPLKNYNEKLQMQISQLDYNNYLGVIGIGRIKKGSIKPNQQINITDSYGKNKLGKINQVLTYIGLKRIPTDLAISGSIVAITGIEKISISDTICDPTEINPLPKLSIDEPTIKMFFSVNSSPFSGKEGKYITSRQISARLQKELIYNVALNMEETNNSNTFCVYGRGELHLSILIENMRREGFELEVSRPKVIFREFDGEKQEPFENIVLDMDIKYQGIVMKFLGERKGEMLNITPINKNRIRLEYTLSSRALIGFRSEYISMTSGTGLFYSSFSHYGNLQKNNIGQRRNGVLISNGTGMAVAFALYNLQERGKLFLSHGAQVYEGQIIGLHNRSNDLTVNCLTGKKLTNMRASGTDESITLTPHICMTLEDYLGFINDDELVEITPKNIRIRKKYLTENERKRLFRKKNKES